MARLLSVSVPDELLAETEALAEAQGRTKSDLVREALRAHLALNGLRAVQSEATALAERSGLGPENAEALVDAVRGAKR